MLLQLAIFSAGLAVLYFGAENLVHGATRLALRYGIRPLVVGLTVVALSTSMPEFVVNVFASLADEPDLALGNIVGSNISNIALILGACALLAPLKVDRQMLRREYPMMLGAMLLFWALAADGRIGTSDGFLLVGCLVAFMAFIVYDARRRPKDAAPIEELEVDEASAPDEERPAWRDLVAVLIGAAMLAGGARLMVMSAVAVAQHLGISEVVIGLTVVAIGTSLPELAASVVGTMRDEADLSLGNVLGSNILNVLFVVGFVAVIKPLPVAPVSLEIHFPVMIAFTLVLFPLAWTQHRITRLEGSTLLTGFAAYMLYLVLVP